MKRIATWLLSCAMLTVPLVPMAAHAQRGGYDRGLRHSGAYNDRYDRGRSRGGGIGPGQGAAIGAGAGAILGLAVGGGLKGALIGGAAGAGVGAVAGQANQNHRDRDWRDGRRY